MKKIILILVLSFFVSNCKAQKNPSDIIYFLPASVKEILYKEVQKTEEKKKNIFFVLDKENEDTFVIYLKTDYNESEKFWLKHSNRSVFLEKQLIIPLYLSIDHIFSYPEKGENVIKKLGTDKGFKRVISIRDHGFQIRFKRNGEIVK
ncbi:hypothetical protein IX39_16105 [Chryseobacterium formosense]|uniref:Beta-lactamase-inhibitor-like PepSY-like domain-containing protein n=1 Tax=Chryseobacterium formosense TaxID=236814 RepID=A0A085Z3B4_9FLAO|nr:hypothetical protein [Chryseobacterium formosense]KFE98927.1 hypothetical protein IX39_16105 [Chryseobacterium formosense]SFT59234.1 hypothetical protein SAMN05421857_1915 [Chryseobacterium formosense]